MFFSRISKDGRYQKNIDHLNEAARIAHAIGKKFLLPSLCKLVAILHDFGKFSLEFINYLEMNFQLNLRGEKSVGRGSVIHSTQGAKYIYDYAGDGDNSIFFNLLREIAAMCIANHHSALMDGISPNGDAPFSDRMTKGDAELNYDEILSNALAEGFPFSDVENLVNESIHELHRYIRFCTDNKLGKSIMIHFLTKMVFSCLVDADRYDAYCFELNQSPRYDNVIPPWEVYQKKLENKLSDLDSSTNNSYIANLRKDISKECLEAASKPKGIYRLGVPTGGGKTLSSMRFALRHAEKNNLEHIIIVIPQLSVIEQTSMVIKDVLGYKNASDFVLEHHSNFVINEDEYRVQAHKLLTDRWDSPIIITTMVQFLESVFSDRSGDLRKFHNMAQSVIIFDEVQSIPIKCVNLFNEAVNFSIIVQVPRYFCALQHSLLLIRLINLF